MLSIAVKTEYDTLIADGLVSLREDETQSIE